MPPARRVRLLCAALLAGVLVTMLWSSHTTRHPAQPFPAPAQPPPPPRTGTGEDSATGEGTKEMAGRLKEAEQKAKDLANSKAPLRPDSPSDVVGVGSAAGGREEGGKEEEETAEEHEAEQELRAILKRAPVIIFSKTFCPHSKRAKTILLEKYTVDPPPHVVELDLHPHGEQLQALLGEKTGRSTVPNVMVNGVSVGGGDEVNELHVSGELEARLEDLGEARKVVVHAREA